MLPVTIIPCVKAEIDLCNVVEWHNQNVWKTMVHFIVSGYMHLNATIGV